MTEAPGITAAIVAAIRPAIEQLGWSETARRCGLHRTHLHHAFGRNADRTPKLQTIERVLPALGLQLTVQCTRAAAPAESIPQPGAIS